jgi:hypothetical protein
LYLILRRLLGRARRRRRIEIEGEKGRGKTRRKTWMNQDFLSSQENIGIQNYMVVHAKSVSYNRVPVASL